MVARKTGAQTGMVVAKFAEEGGPGDCIVGAAAVQQNHCHVWIMLDQFPARC